jgi:hypothetical protein
MECAWCQKSILPGQPKSPLGGGWLVDSYGQFEHSECQDKRFKLIADDNRRFMILERKMYSEEPS